MEPKEYKILRFKVEDADEEDENTGIIKGIASTKGLDLGDDIVMRGAFKKTLAEQKAFPKLLDHVSRKPAGFSRMKETSKGLEFKSTLKLFDPEVRQRFELAKLSLEFDAPMGVSIGFAPVKFSFDEIDGKRVRKLKEVQLFETSLVTFPMNQQATVTGVKAQQFLEIVDRLYREGHDMSEIQKALAKLGQDPDPLAATLSDDPDMVQSMEALRKVFRS